MQAVVPFNNSASVKVELLLVMHSFQILQATILLIFILILYFII